MRRSYGHLRFKNRIDGTGYYSFRHIKYSAARPPRYWK